MELLDLACGEGLYGVVHIPLPEWGLGFTGGECSLFHILHHQVGNSDWDRKTHGFAKGLLVHLPSVWQVGGTWETTGGHFTCGTHLTVTKWGGEPPEVLPVCQFRDTLITHHDDGTLSTTVFRKKTHTDRYLNFESHHPLAHKAAVARTLLTWADRICMDFPDKAKEKEHLPKCWGWMRIPENWSPRTGNPQHTTNNLRCQTHPKPKWSFRMSDLSQIIRRILTSLGVYTCFRPHHTLCGTLVHLKDRTSFRRRAGVVYRIPCGSYIYIYIAIYI